MLPVHRIFGLGLGLAAAAPAAAAPDVVVDVAAVHSIVARVMKGIGKPTLLLPPGSSPHDYSLHPSEAAALEEAELVFWVGEAYTPWLADPISTLADDALRVALMDTPGIVQLPLREGGPFERDPHDDHALDEDADHAGSVQEPGGHGEAVDGHVWLDPLNAAEMAQSAARALAEVDPVNGEMYSANAKLFAREMGELVRELAGILARAEDRPYIVFHDAYQYFENRFGLPASGSLSLHDAEQPSPARLVEIRDRIRADGVACVFAEPQFPSSLVQTAIEGTGARPGVLDPIGAQLQPGPDFYPALMRGLAHDLVGCLAGPQTGEDG